MTADFKMPPRPYIQRLLIKQFRNTPPDTEITFSPHLNILLGKNGTGKTTILEILSAFMRDDFSRFDKEPFHFELTIFYDDRTGQASAQKNIHEPLQRRSDGAYDFIRMSFRFSTHQNTEWRLGRFDESLGFFDFLTQSKGFYLDILYGNTGVIYIEGVALSAELLEHFTPKPIEVERVVISSPARNYPDSPFLDAFQELNDLTRAELRLEPQVLPSTIGKHLFFNKMDFRFYLRNGAEMTHDFLSFGQKRLLSLLYYFDCNPKLVLIDEITNGFHYDWIDACMGMISDRQCFLTSQNPLLVNWLVFEDAEQVCNTFVKCTLDEQYQMRWANPTKEEAAEFWGAYQVGIQSVSDILRAQGLW
jgi:energy-coupling factor transporter ATP-binding protein EcfA2